MIGLRYNIPYIDMEPYIDMQQFLDLKQEICLGIARSTVHYSNPGNRTFANDRYPEQLLPYESETRWKELTKDLSVTERRKFLKWYKKVYYSTNGIFIKQHEGYLNKHLEEYSKWTENAVHFPKFIEYIENNLPFEQTGRIFIFCQDNFAHLTEHRDSMNDDYDNHLTDFLWFTIDKNAMRFYIRDEKNNKKHYVESNCAWFDENDRHGSDGVQDPTFCIRIDGVFNASFKQKIINDIKQ